MSETSISLETDNLQNQQSLTYEDHIRIAREYLNSERYNNLLSQTARAIVASMDIPSKTDNKS